MSESAVERLKVTSPRLNQDEFKLTPSGKRAQNPTDRNRAGNPKPTRAQGPWADPTPAVETEDTTLDRYDGDEEVSR
jgi:hypothetical protein